MCEICSKLIKIPDLLQLRHSGVLIVIFKQVAEIVLTEYRLGSYISFLSLQHTYEIQLVFSSLNFV